MHEAYAISSYYLVSSMVMSEAEIDICGLLCFSMLILTVVKRAFQQQLDYTVLTINITTDVFDDALVVVLDAAGQIHREGIEQNLHWTNAVDCIFSLPKLVVSINYTWNLDTPSGSQNEEANSRNSVAWINSIERTVITGIHGIKLDELRAVLKLKARLTAIKGFLEKLNPRAFLLKLKVRFIISKINLVLKWLNTKN
ncbi:hypothetical protein H5410_035538 [Solanum commersonii]|uniref:Uncharacterized protein n=1 Tax=Solanum commersonii TaxID=4109 RepID=A0A9J5Y2X8_SOLCO|nr:hypothetical protein H5410_035538 [Solanum commersonii]